MIFFLLTVLLSILWLYHFLLHVSDTFRRFQHLKFLVVNPIYIAWNTIHQESREVHIPRVGPSGNVSVLICVINPGSQYKLGPAKILNKLLRVFTILCENIFMQIYSEFSLKLIKESSFKYFERNTLLGV